QIDDPQLMWAGHRHVKFSVVRERVPRRIERYGPAHARDVELARLLSRADQRLHHAGFQIGAADQMVLGVADVKRIAVNRQSLRMIELCFGERAIFRDDRAIADHVLSRYIERSDDHAVVIRIGDEQPVARLIGQRLTRIGQQAGRRGEFFEPEADRLFVELVLGAEVSGHLPDDIVEDVENAFARMRADFFAFRIDQDQRRPPVCIVAMPDIEILVVDDRMSDLVAQYRLADVFRAFLVLELGRMHADDHELVGLLRLKLLQIGDDVHAVDAAIRPEIEQHDFAAQVTQADRFFRIEPFHARREIGSVDITLKQFIFLRSHFLAFLGFGLLLSERRAAGDEEQRYNDDSHFDWVLLLPRGFRRMDYIHYLADCGNNHNIEDFSMRNLVTFSAIIEIVAITSWVGGMAALAFIAAPAIFQTAVSREQAGKT